MEEGSEKGEWIMEEERVKMEGIDDLLIGDEDNKGSSS